MPRSYLRDSAEGGLFGKQMLYQLSYSRRALPTQNRPPPARPPPKWRSLSASIVAPWCQKGFATTVSSGSGGLVEGCTATTAGEVSTVIQSSHRETAPTSRDRRPLGQSQEVPSLANRNCSGATAFNPYLRTSSGHPLVVVVKTTENRSSEDPARLRWASAGWRPGRSLQVQ